MNMIILGCFVQTEVKDDGVEYILVGFNLTTDAPGGKRYGATRNIPMADSDMYNKPYEDICYKVLLDTGRLIAHFRQFLPEKADNEDVVVNDMRDLAIEGLSAFFSTNEWWSKKLHDVHDVKAGSMIKDATTSEEYMLERDIRVVTSIVSDRDIKLDK